MCNFKTFLSFSMFSNFVYKSSPKQSKTMEVYNGDGVQVKHTPFLNKFSSPQNVEIPVRVEVNSPKINLLPWLTNQYFMFWKLTPHLSSFVSMQFFTQDLHFQNARLQLKACKAGAISILTLCVQNYFFFCKMLSINNYYNIQATDISVKSSCEMQKLSNNLHLLRQYEL